MFNSSSVPSTTFYQDVALYVAVQCEEEGDEDEGCRHFWCVYSMASSMTLLFTVPSGHDIKTISIRCIVQIAIELCALMLLEDGG